MAKSKGRRRSRSSGMHLPVAVLAGFVPLVLAAKDGYQYNGWSGVGKRISLGLTGYNPEDRQWYPAEMLKVGGPIIAGIVAHKLAGRLGINRALANAGVPFVRI